jgi:Kdo2-lipid IVA lauroyltransferase/acyltransferase
MSAGNLSRFFQAPVNAAIFAWYPPLVLRSYVRMLGRLYFHKKPLERSLYLQALRETFRASHLRREVDAELEKRVLHGIFDHYFEKMLSAYWGYERVRAYLLQRVTLVHADLLDGALSEGRGVIISTGHFGAVEFLPGSLAFRGYPITMVVKYKTQQLKRTMEEIARRAGVEAIDAAEGSVMPRALAALRGGRIFITELDEMSSWKPTAHKVMNFFGRRITLDRTVELIHRRTGAPVLLALMERVGTMRYQLVLETPQEHHAAPTGLGPDAQLLKRLEHYVYDAPDHWYIWKDLHHLEQLQPA